MRMLNWSLERLYDWLSPSDPVISGDLIFALAGRQSRKLYALELFRQGMGNSLLLSVGRFEIRKFAQLSWPAEIDLVRVAAPTPAALRHYFVSMEAGKSEVELIAKGRFGTLSEIRALAAWLQRRPHIRSLVVVSSGPHLRRVRACCRALLPERVQFRFLPTPDDGWLTRSDWWRDAHSRRVVAKEVGKLFIYRLLLMAGRGVST
ncbi:MAG TPA: ElyC/SanA/YdcF family protein [Terriglobales bacterium]|nr:ElyC/SanA/YdcF family protein [Terriglobales bacterium]